MSVFAKSAPKHLNAVERRLMLIRRRYTKRIISMKLDTMDAVLDRCLPSSVFKPYYLNLKINVNGRLNIKIIAKNKNLLNK